MMVPYPARAAGSKAEADGTLCTMSHLSSVVGRNEIPWVTGRQCDHVVKQIRDFKTVQCNDDGNLAGVRKSLSDRDFEEFGHHPAGFD